MKWHKIPLSIMVEKKPIQLVKLGGHKFCLIYDQDKWHATSFKCPHAGANLAGGWCENGRLICPYHRHSFDLMDGKGAAGQNDCISIYPIEQRQNDFYIQLPESIITKLLNYFG